MGLLTFNDLELQCLGVGVLRNPPTHLKDVRSLQGLSYNFFVLKYVEDMPKIHQNPKKKMGITDLLQPPLAPENLPYFIHSCGFLDVAFVLFRFEHTVDYYEGKRKFLINFQIFHVIISQIRKYGGINFRSVR